MANKTDIEKKKCLTPEFQVSFPHVFEAQTAFPGQEAKYSVVMLFDKKENLDVLKKAVFNAAVEKFGPKEKWPKGLRLPFRDGDEKQDLGGYAGRIFVSATSKMKPGLVNGRLEEIIAREEFYAGCYARATLIAFAYDKAGNKGVSFSLQNLQKTKDGTPFSGRRKASDEFEAIDDGSDKPESYSEANTEDDGYGF